MKLLQRVGDIKARTYCDSIVVWINCFWSVMGAFINGFARIHDEGNWGRKVVSYTILGITLYATGWSIEYANAHDSRPAIEIAAIIAAVLAPIGVLQGAVVKYFLEANSRTEQIKAGITS